MAHGIEARAPSKAKDKEFCNWWATYLRMGASPGAVLALTKMNAQIDIRHVLKSIRVPTIVLHRTGDHCLLVAEGRFLAEQIPGAKFVELAGNDHLPFVGNQDDFLNPITEFLTGLQPNQQVHRVLATVLCAKMMSKTESSESQQVGLEHFVREVELFRGQMIQVSNNELTARFDGPARAIRAALAVRDSASRLGIDVQLGLHTGECEILLDRVSGPAVELAESVAEFGEQCQVVVSSTVKDLVAGSGLHFTAKSTVRLTDELPACQLFVVQS